MKQVQKPVILKNNRSFLAINKPSGWLSQSGKTDETPIHEHFETRFNTKLHLLNRIDRPVSGLLLLSKTRAFTKSFLDAQEKNLITKTYLAIVEGKVGKENVELENWLAHDKRKMRSYITDESNKKARKCSLIFRRVGLFENYTLLEVIIKQGKFHQIRAQLAEYGHPIKGDVKYGARRGNRDRSIHLHSYRLDINDPAGEQRSFTAPILNDDSLWESVPGMLEQNP